MTGAQFGAVILGLIVVAIVVAIVVWLLNWLYLRSSKERAFVRTGLGGQKVVMNGGAFVLPIVHEVIPVNMNTLRLEVSRGRDKALITKDRMRVDVVAEFYVRVQASPEAIAVRGADARPAHHAAGDAEGAGRRQVRRRAAHRRRRDDDGGAAREARRVRQARARRGGGRPAAERPRARDGLADAARPDRDGVLQSVQRVRRRGPHPADRADRAAQEDPQRHRAGHDDPDPQQEPGDRAAGARHRPRARVRAAGAGARAGDAARGASAPTWRASAPSKEQEAERAQIGAREAVERARIARSGRWRRSGSRSEREVQQLEIERRKALELAEQQRAIAVAEQSKAQSEAQARGRPGARARRWPRRSACSPRARPRWPSGASASS